MLTAATFSHLWLAVCNVHATLLRPLKYQLRQARVYASLNVIVAWILAIILAVPPFIVLMYYKSDVGSQCQPRYWFHTFTSTLSPFYVPLLVLIGLHAWVSAILRKQTHMARILSMENASVYSTSNGDVTFDNMELKFETLANGQMSGRSQHKTITRMGSNDSCNSISDAEDDDPSMNFSGNVKNDSPVSACPSQTDVADAADEHQSIGDGDSLTNTPTYGEAEGEKKLKKVICDMDSESSDVNSISDLDLRYAIAKNIHKAALSTSISNCSTVTGTSFVENHRYDQMTMKTTVGEIPAEESNNAKANTVSDTTGMDQTHNSGQDNALYPQDDKRLTDNKPSDVVESQITSPPKPQGSSTNQSMENLSKPEDVELDTVDNNVTGYQQNSTGHESDITTSDNKSNTGVLSHQDSGESEGVKSQLSEATTDNTDTSLSNSYQDISKDQTDVCDTQITQGMGPKRQSKELLNEPLENEEEDYQMEMTIDTETLIGSLEMVKQKRESMEEDNAAFVENEGDSEEMPLTNAIRVKRPSDPSTDGSVKSSSSGSENGSLKKGSKKKQKPSKPKSRDGSLTKEEKEKKNRLCLENDISVVDPRTDKNHLSYPPTRQPSRMSTVSYGSAPGPDGQRRSILRRDGSCRSSNIRKSVKFASEKNTEHPIPRETKKLGEAKRISTRRKTPRKQRRRPRGVNGSVRSTSSNGSTGTDSDSSNHSRVLTRQNSTSSSNGSIQLTEQARARTPTLTRQNSVMEEPGDVISPTDVMPELEDMDYMTRVHHTQGMRITLRIKRQRNVLVNVLIIFIIYILLSLPNVIANMSTSLCPDCLDYLGFATKQIILVATEWTRLSSSAVMPILYLCISADFRSALKKFCLRKHITRTNTLDHIKY